MSKLAPQTVVFAPGEKAKKNFNFAADLDTASIGATPNFTMQSGGPAPSFPAYSGAKAQAFFDATGVSPGVYYCDCEIVDNSTPPQLFKGRGKFVVANLG
jgi:hypothetical protein